MGFRSPYTAIAATFFLAGLFFSTAVARLPAIQEGLALSDGELAVALVGLNGGAVVGLQAGAVLCRRIGSRTTLRAALPVFALLLIPMAVAPTMPALVAAFAASAAVNGVIDVAINANGVALERRSGRVVLSRLHAMLTLGGIGGAAAGAVAARFDVGVPPQFLATALLGTVAAALTTRRLTSDSATAAAKATRATQATRSPTSNEATAAAEASPAALTSNEATAVAEASPAALTSEAATAVVGAVAARDLMSGEKTRSADVPAARKTDGAVDAAPTAVPEPPAPLAPPAPRRAGWVLGFGGLAFCVMLAEGSANDWTAVYLHQVGGSDVLAAGGVAVFLAAMTAGRLGGDHLRQRVTAAPLVRGGALLAAGGLGTALLIGHPAAGLAGFGLLGLGLSVTLPVILGEAAHRAAANGTSPAATVAQVSTVAYLGSFIGPGLIGVLATATTLETALLLPVAATAVAALGAGLLASRHRPTTKASTRALHR